MKMDKVAGSGNDEFYTPEYAVKPIEQYVLTSPRNFKHVWCPFDTHESHFVKRFGFLGLRVTHSHISYGQDFFQLPTPKGVDLIISNPPYSMKTEVLQNLFDRGVPFAMLVGVVGLFESQTRFKMFRDHDFEILYLDKRVSYLKNYADEKPAVNPPFSSVYVCHHVLPTQICFGKVIKP